MKKSTKHMQFIRISLLIFALGFFFACSLGTQSYGKLSLSIEIPEYLKTEPNEQPSNARFIHPNGDRLEFKLYTERRVIHTQSITLNPQSNNTKPQTVSISVDKVPYNVPLFAEITVFGKTSPTHGYDGLLGSNNIYIGYLKSGNNKLTLGVKPVSDTTVTYKNMDGDGIYLGEYFGNSADTFKIKMFPEKGLYTFRVDYPANANIYLYDSDGKNYPNSCFIDNLCVFYHPEDIKSTYYAYSNVIADEFSGEKLKQDILISMYDVIVNSEEYEKPLGQVVDEDDIISLDLTIYNPYPFTLNLTYKIENADGDDVNPDSKDKFTFTDFPDVLVLLPGKSKKFTVNFQDKTYSSNTTYKVKSTISANGLKDFVLLFTGSTSQP